MRNAYKIFIKTSGGMKETAYKAQHILEDMNTGPKEVEKERERVGGIGASGRLLGT
jgi:hypothetical protein